MVLCLAVWAPGNEKVISKIQGLGEGHMAELMRGIEEVMASMPEEEGSAIGEEEGEGGMMERLSRRGSPVKKADIRCVNRSLHRRSAERMLTLQQTAFTTWSN